MMCVVVTGVKGSFVIWYEINGVALFKASLDVYSHD